MICNIRSRATHDILQPKDVARKFSPSHQCADETRRGGGEGNVLLSDLSVTVHIFAINSFMNCLTYFYLNIIIMTMIFKMMMMMLIGKILSSCTPH